MKIQLDTNAKTIKVEESVNLGELIEAMEKLLPNWKEFKIEPTTITAWANPIIIERRTWPSRPYYWPWWQDSYQTNGIGGQVKYRSPTRLGQDISMSENQSNIYNLQIE